MNVTSRRSEFLPFLLVLFTGALLAALIAPKGLELFGYGGMTLEAILARPEVGVGRSLLLSQGLYALFMFLLPALFLYQRWHDGRVASLLQPSWSALDSLLAWIILPALLPALNACNSLWVGAAHGMDFMAPHAFYADLGRPCRKYSRLCCARSLFGRISLSRQPTEISAWASQAFYGHSWRHDCFYDRSYELHPMALLGGSRLYPWTCVLSIWPLVDQLWCASHS